MLNPTLRSIPSTMKQFLDHLPLEVRAMLTLVNLELDQLNIDPSAKLMELISLRQLQERQLEALILTKNERVEILCSIVGLMLLETMIPSN
jgi:hypothetical protein